MRRPAVGRSVGCFSHLVPCHFIYLISSPTVRVLCGNRRSPPSGWIRRPAEEPSPTWTRRDKWSPNWRNAITRKVTCSKLGNSVLNNRFSCCFVTRNNRHVLNLLLLLLLVFLDLERDALRSPSGEGRTDAAVDLATPPLGSQSTLKAGEDWRVAEPAGPSHHRPAGDDPDTWKRAGSLP